MNRRSFLSLAGISVLAGCSVSELGGADEPSPRTVIITRTVTVGEGSTEEPNPTPTPEPASVSTPTPNPQILSVNLITDWKEFGDVVENRIGTIETTENPTIGVRFIATCGDEREVRWRNVTTVRDESGETVASESAESNEFSNICAQYRSVEWEQAIRCYYNNEFGTNWPVGEYEATVRIDDYYGAKSVNKSTEFEVVSSA